MFGGGLGILLDSHEPNPALRYKISGGAPAGCYSDNGSANCLTGTAGSPDGINNWTDVKKLEFSRPWRADCHTNIIYDPPSAQYYMTTRDYENGDGREISIANASVFDHWTQPTIVEKGSGAHQLYSQITWRFYDVFLGIVMVFDAETGSKGPDAGHVHCMLSWAPTALGPWEWVDVKGLEGLSEFIPKGPPGSFESHVCFAAHRPLRMPDGTTRIYYMGEHKCDYWP